MEMLRMQFQIEYLNSAVTLLLSENKVDGPDMDAGKWYAAKLNKNKQGIDSTYSIQYYYSMNKKILSAILAVALITPISAQAASVQNKTVSGPTIAILDGALDTSLPIFKDRIL